ncbi:MAG: thioredoxin family protein [Deltaproteobacteria bacterium]|nr:thioredoxin family protein [Deltaproteobacteria bacterium]
MKMQILGTGRAKSKALTENVKTAVAEMQIAANIEKVEDIKDIMSFGAMSTPALVVDGKVKCSGKLLTPAEIKIF